MRVASRTVDSRWAMTMVVRPARSSRNASITAASDIASRADVGSSRRRMGASLSSARAMPMRWRSPPESDAPSSATSVRYPRGRRATKSWTWAARAAASTSSSPASSLP